MVRISVTQLVAPLATFFVLSHFSVTSDLFNELLNERAFSWFQNQFVFMSFLSPDLNIIASELPLDMSPYPQSGMQLLDK